MTANSFFRSKYPVVQAPMNQCSDLTLAIAVSRAGAFPSLFLDKSTDIPKTLKSFLETTGGKNVVIPIGAPLLLNEPLVKTLYDFAPSHIEVFPADLAGNHIENFSPAILAILKLLRTRSSIMLRIFNPQSLAQVSHVDALCIKGKESAGKTGDWSVMDLFDKQKELTPDMPLIPYGGIGLPSHVATYLAKGAVAVGVGTLFAACEESPVNLNVKQKMVEASSADLTMLTKRQQNCLVFDEPSGNIDPNDWNSLARLKQGVHGDGTTGLIYAGQAINHIDRIRSAKETVEFLCSDLPGEKP